MPRSPDGKPRVAVSVSIRSDTHQQVLSLARATKKPLSHIVEEALLAYIRELEGTR